METYRTKKPNAKVSWLAEALSLSRKCLNTTTATEEKQPKTGDKELVTEITLVLHDFPYYGYRRVTPQLKRQGTDVNKKRIQRIMHEHGLAQKRRRRFIKTTDSRHQLPTYPNLVADIIPSYPCHVWAADITYVRLEKGFCYVALIVDTFTRKVVGWAVDTHMEVSLVMEALHMALEGGTPDYHHSDRGGQYCAKEYVALLIAHGVQISMADAGMSVDNPYAESLNRTLKVEEVYLKEYYTVLDARREIKHFVEVVYNTKRLHSSIGYVPPVEFEAAWYATQVSSLRTQEGAVLLKM
jgi:putative transposase